jgi:hypothetical protein
MIPGVCLANLNSSCTRHMCVPRVTSLAAFHPQTSSRVMIQREGHGVNCKADGRTSLRVHP